MGVVRINLDVLTDSTSLPMNMPALVTNHGVVMPLVRYFLRHHVKSPSWRKRVAHSAYLLMEYMIANHDRFRDPRELYSAFGMRMYTGTIDQTGDDPSGLFWVPRTRGAVRASLNDVAAFSDFLVDEYGADSLNPPRVASPAEQGLFWAAYHHRKGNAFLGHAWDREAATEAAKVTKAVLTRKPLVFSHKSEEPPFPEEKFPELITRGLMVGERYNLRDALVILLLHNGPRLSETLHLFAHDVIPDPLQPDIALVRIYHPEEGLAPNDWFNEHGEPIVTNRQDYLRGKYGMAPRTQQKPTTAMYVGWKGAALESRRSKHFQVRFFPNHHGALFWQLWIPYLSERDRVMRANGTDHPFAFVNKRGEPLGVASFRDSHMRAMKRIGVEPQWGQGGTPHCHRHAYARRLKNAGITDPKILQKLLQHRSVRAQDAYAPPSDREISEALNRANLALEASAFGLRPTPSAAAMLGHTDTVDPRSQERRKRRRA